MSGTLILVRHGQSEWNLKNLFTGWRNPDLTEQGVGEARHTGKTLKANGLVAVEEIMPVSARLIVNQAALKTKRATLQPLIDAFAKASAR